MNAVACSTEVLSTLTGQLERGLTFLKIEPGQGVCRSLIQYLELLLKWNRVYNLTAIREPEKIVSHHLLDSAAILPHLPVGDILDVGTGPGLPGIPLALLCPNVRVTLLDANQKKTAFLRQAVGELGLRNVEVVCDRVEAWATDRRFSLITSRAFSELADFVRGAGWLLAETGRLVAMKGVYPKDEVDRLPPGYRIDEVIELHVPGVVGARHLVLIGRV